MEPPASKEGPLGPCDRCARTNRRRALLKLGIGGVGLSLIPSIVLAQTDPALMPPQEGDVFVRQKDATFTPVGPGDVPGGAQLTLAWAMNPATQVVRSQDRLNQVLLIKLDPATLDPETQSLSVEGIVAYSALCTHAGCIITDWVPEQGVLVCDCHSSEFDPRARGKVVAAPAARPLPALPLKLLNGILVVAKPFAVPIRFDE
jgi:rieske iron-sulfur protein